MEVLKAIIIGIIQGLTEFLPVSSSGHIELAQELLCFKTEEDLLFSLVLHAATALSTVVIFKKDILEIIQGIFKTDQESIGFVFKIILSMIPVGVMVGFFGKEKIEAFFKGDILLVGFMLLITGLLLLLADKARNTDKNVSFSDAFIIGIAQAIAILPGISRSGATISTSVLLGNDRSKAARFSFLMVIPVIFGAMAKDLFEKGSQLNLEGELLNLSAGFIAAFVAGIFACQWMIALVKKSKLKYFSYYCFVVGISAIIYAFSVKNQWIEPICG